MHGAPLNPSRVCSPPRSPSCLFLVPSPVSGHRLHPHLASNSSKCSANTVGSHFMAWKILKGWFCNQKIDEQGTESSLVCLGGGQPAKPRKLSGGELSPRWNHRFLLLFCRSQGTGPQLISLSFIWNVSRALLKGLGQQFGTPLVEGSDPVALPHMT